MNTFSRVMRFVGLGIRKNLSSLSTVFAKKVSMARFRQYVIVMAALVVATGACLADEVPKFKQGMWEYDKTLVVNGKELHQKFSRCTDPTDDMREFMKPGALMNCKWGKPTQSGNRYTLNSMCENGTHKEIVRIVKSDSSYDEISDDFGLKTRMKQTLLARRTGNCIK